MQNFGPKQQCVTDYSIKIRENARKNIAHFFHKMHFFF